MTKQQATHCWHADCKQQGAYHPLLLLVLVLQTPIMCLCLSVFAVCETTVALVVRPGNPKNIQSWDDLIQPGLQVSML
jgi:hypothetical protein